MHLRRDKLFSAQPRLEHALPPHEHPRNEQGRRRESNDRPNNFHRNAREPPEMRLREPGQHLISKTEAPAGRIQRLEIIDDGVERGRNREVNSRERPHEKERKGPKPERAVQRPVKSFGIRFPAEAEAAAPGIDPRPPDHGARQAEEYGEDSPGGVDQAARLRNQKIVVQVREPEDKAKSESQRNRPDRRPCTD